MTAEQLNIQLKLDLKDFKESVRKVKQDLNGFGDEARKSMPKVTTESNKAKTALDQMGKEGEQAKKAIKEIGDQATTSINKVQGFTAKLRQALSGANNAKTGNTTLNVDAGGVEGANTSLEETYGILQAIVGLNFADLFISNWDKIKGSTQGVKDSIKGIKDAFVDATKAGHDNFKDLKKSISDVGYAFSQEFKKDMKDGWGEDMPVKLKDRLYHARYESKKLSDAMGNLKKTSISAFKGIGAAVGNLAKSLIGLGGQIAAVSAALIVVVGTISSLGISRLGKQFYDSAQMANMSTQAYQKWGYALERVGVEADEVREIVKTLTEAQIDALSGAEDYAQAFEQLGISQAELAASNPEQLFERSVAALQGMENTTQRTAIAYKLFAEDATKLSQIINMTSQDAAILAANYRNLGSAMSGNLIQLSVQTSNAINNLKNAFMGLRNTLAELFLPVIQRVVTWLARVIAIINMFLRAIFNLDTSTGSKTAQTLSGSFVQGTKAANGYSAAVNEAKGAVEKLKRAAMGFDELNILPGKNSTPGSSGSSGGGGDTGVTTPDYGTGFGGASDLFPVEDLNLDKWKAFVDKYKQIIQDIAAATLTGIGVIGFFTCLFTGNWLGAAGYAALAGLGLYIGFQEGGLWDRIGDSLKNTWENVKTWFSQNVAPKFTKEYWVKKFDSFKDGATDAWNKFKQSPAGQFFAGIGDKVVELKAKFVEVGASVRQTIINAWDKIKTKTSELKTKFTDGWPNTRKTLAGAWDKIKTKTSTLTGNFKRTGYYQTLSNYWDKFKTKTSTLTVAFKDAFTSKIKAAWNGLVKAINKAITTINKIPGVNIPKLPQLARGGIVTGPTTAVIGEAGAEMVLPLQNNTGWMDILANKIAGIIGGGGNGPTQIILQVDGRQLGWAAIDNINEITKQGGNLPLVLG